jgi:hypothetical protein
MVIDQDHESHLRAKFVFVLRCTHDCEVRGGQESGLGLCEGHNRFLDSKGGWRTKGWRFFAVDEDRCLKRSLYLNTRTSDPSSAVCVKPQGGSLDAGVQSNDWIVLELL